VTEAFKLELNVREFGRRCERVAEKFVVLAESLLR